MNDNILDDIELEENESKLDGTNQQLIRGLVLGLIVQTLLWSLTDKIGDSSYSENPVFEIKAINYKLTIIICMVSVSVTLGGLSFCFFSNASKQYYKKIMGTGLLFSILSIASLLGYMALKGDLDMTVEDVFQLILLAFVGMSFIATIGWILVFRTRFLYLGILLLIIPFIVFPLMN